MTEDLDMLHSMLFDIIQDKDKFDKIKSVSWEIYQTGYDYGYEDGRNEKKTMK